MKHLVVTAALLMSTSVMASNTITAGLVKGDTDITGIEFNGGIIVYEQTLTNAPGLGLIDHGVYGSYSFATTDDICFGGYCDSIDATSLAIGWSYATGTPLKLRIGVSFNRYIWLDGSDDEIGMDLGISLIGYSGLTGTAGYNTELETFNAGVGYTW